MTVRSLEPERSGPASSPLDDATARLRQALNAALASGDREGALRITTALAALLGAPPVDAPASGVKTARKHKA
jgi:hypothetical protein